MSFEDLKYEWKTVGKPLVAGILSGLRLVFFPFFLVFGKGVLQKPVHRTPEEIISILGRLTEHQCSEAEWNDFVSRAIDDVHLDDIRLRACELNIRFKRHGYPDFISPEGVRVIHQLRSAVLQKESS